MLWWLSRRHSASGGVEQVCSHIRDSFGRMPPLMGNVSSARWRLLVEGSYMYHVHQMFTILVHIVYLLCLTFQKMSPGTATERINKFHRHHATTQSHIPEWLTPTLIDVLSSTGHLYGRITIADRRTECLAPSTVGVLRGRLYTQVHPGKPRAVV